VYLNGVNSLPQRCVGMKIYVYLWQLKLRDFETVKSRKWQCINHVMVKYL